MRNITKVQEHQKEKQRPKNEPTRHFEDILANRNNEDKQIKQNRENYGFKE